MAEFREDMRQQGREEVAAITACLNGLAGHVGTAIGSAAYAMSPDGRRVAQRRRERRQAAMIRIAKRLVAATAAILVAAIAAGIVIGPIGLGGLMATVLAVILAWIAIIALSARERDMPPERFVQGELGQLPASTERWLETQRPALPAPAQRQIDAIGLSLEQIAPQLAAIDPREPVAVEARRLIGEELPELVRGYGRVPEPLRRQPLNGGPSPDAQVAEGLSTIRQEIDRMNARLATGDLHALATQQRYLELKYNGNGPGS